MSLNLAVRLVDVFENVRTPTDALKALVQRLETACKNLSGKHQSGRFRPGGLQNGLSADENRRLFNTTDTAEAAEHVLEGLRRIAKRSK